MADAKKQQLVLAFVDFLNESIQDGTVRDDDKEGLEVAIQCIGEAFGIDPSDDTQRKQLSIKPAKLQTIFDVFLKTRDKVASPAPASTTSAPSTSPQPKTPSQEDKKKAEKHKQTGNTQMSAKKHDSAIDSYSKAIALDPTNAVYFSNRAAAYSSKGDHSSAVEDAKRAIDLDPAFVKAYSRLGHAHYSLGDYKAAAAAFSKGTELDPTNENLKSGLKNSKDHLSPDDDDDGPPPLMSEDQLASSPPSNPAGSDATPNLPGLADMFGGGGGMPDLAGMMNNPMMMQMAQQLMANGGLERIMSNPAVANMMGRVQSGQMPSMEELMSDPTLRNLASQFATGNGNGNGRR